MAGRKQRKNCFFCQHPQRDMLEHEIRIGTLSPAELDKEQGWPEGTSHRHMRRHAGEYHNNSNSECPICTHPERNIIEESILEQRASMDEFAVELGVDESVIHHHMDRHIKPVIQAQAELEVLPTALSTVKDSLLRVEKNMLRMDRILGLHLDTIENAMMDESEMVSAMDLGLAVKLHKEVRETLTDLAKWMDKAETIETSQSVSVLTIIQGHFAEKAPEEWRELRKSLAEAGVLE